MTAPRGPVRRPVRALLVAAPLLALVPAPASAAPPWVERGITLPGGDWAFDFGLGIAHGPVPHDDTAAGMNLEMAVSPADRVELGARTGLRFGDADHRALGPDGYGRLFDRQYFDGGADVLANPEFRVRVALVRAAVVQLGVEGRVIVPLAAGDNAGLEPGLPLALHLGDRVRLDTGVWVPILAGPNSTAGVSVPLDIWIQVTPRVWLGPMTGIQGFDNATFVSMGFGFGYQIHRAIDFKAMFLFPELNQSSDVFGLGAGLQFRIE